MIILAHHSLQHTNEINLPVILIILVAAGLAALVWRINK